MGFEFLGFDDMENIVHNVGILGFNAENLEWIFFSKQFRPPHTSTCLYLLRKNFCSLYATINELNIFGLNGPLKKPG